MINYAQADPRFLDDLTLVVDALVARTGIDPDQILVVGAGCRDIMHSALGHTFPLRGTSDTDLGIAVADWAVTDKVENAFPRTGNSGIRYLIEGLPVDIMPFGGVEDPSGISHPAPRGEDLIVFGFTEVHQHAGRLRLPSGAHVRVPSIPGYTALKLRSWIDRSAFGEYKDANDLAVAAFWYRESSTLDDRLYNTDFGTEILESVMWDVPLAAAQLLGADAAGLLSADGRVDLAERWSRTSTESLAQRFVLPPGAPADFSLERRREVIAHLSAGITGAARSTGE